MSNSQGAPLLASGDHVARRNSNDHAIGAGTDTATDASIIIGNKVDDDDDDDDDDDVTSRSFESSRDHVTHPFDRQSPGVFVWMLALAAGISGLLFGYDTGVISATLVSIGTSLSARTLTPLDKSIITSCTSLFALIASPLASLVADRLGRRPVVLVADVLFAVGAALQARSTTVAAMVVGRCVVGAAIGAASFVVPLYLAEVAPARHRGRLVTLNVLCITAGQVAAYVVGWLFAEHAAPGVGWRWMVGLGAVPAVVQGLLVTVMPETPRWLASVGRGAEARAVVIKTNAGGSWAGWSGDEVARHADRLVKEIEMEVKEERGSGRALNAWAELTSVGKNRRALVIACLLQGLQQLCGFNSLMYFSATIFAMVGFPIPTLTSLSVAGTNFVFTVAALVLIDRIGRRRILLYSVPFMVGALLVSAYGFSGLDLDTSLSSTGFSLSSTPEGAGHYPPPPTAAIVILIGIIIYVAGYAMGLGNVPWMQSELFPLSVRSLGSGVATATNWGANLVVGLTFLPLLDALGAGPTFVLYAAVCTAGWMAVWRVYPETAGLSLEEAGALLEGGWGV